MKQYVLIRKGQRSITADQLAEMIRTRGFRGTAELTGLGDSTLRKFMAEEGYRFKANTSWQVERLPGLETDAEDPPVAAEAPRPAEHQGEGAGLGGVESGGVQV